MQGFTFTFTNITVWVHSVQFSYVISAMLIQPNVLPSLLTSILYNFPGNVFLQNELWWDSKLMFTVWQCITAWLHQLLTEKFKTHEPMYLCKPHISCYSFHLHKNSWLQSLFLKNSIRRIRRDLSLSLPWLSIYLKKKTSYLHWSPVADCPGIIQHYCTTTAKNETHTYYTLLRVGFVWRKVKVLSHFIHSTSLLH